jgi:DNA polymerase III epsilon subunit-like protein
MYLFFDTETTGIPKNWKAPLTDFENWPRLVQLAFQLFDDEGILINEEDYIIKPHGFKIPPESTAIHGITNEQATSEGISLSSVLDDFSSILEDVHTIVAHNLSFDEKIVGCEYLRMGLPNPLVEKNRICTMESSTNYCAIDGPYGYKWPKLSELYFKVFNTKLEETHNALVDIRATSKCFWELVIRDIIELNQTSSFPNNLSKNNIEDENSIINNDQIKTLIDEFHSLTNKLKSNTKHWNYLNKSWLGEDKEGQWEIAQEMETLDFLSSELESELDRVKLLLEEQGITENNHPELFEEYSISKQQDEPSVIIPSKDVTNKDENVPSIAVVEKKEEIVPCFVEKDGVKKYGYFLADSKKVIIECRYDKTYPFEGDYAMVLYREKIRYVNRRGDIEIVPNENSTNAKLQGASIQPPGREYGDYNCKYGFINQFSDDLVFLPFIYQRITEFHNGKAVVKKNNKYGFINIYGEELTPFIYIFISDKEKYYDWHIIYLDKKCGYIDRNTFSFPIPLIYDNIGWFQNDTDVKVDDTDENHNFFAIAQAKKDGKWGFINRIGEEVISFIYEDIKDISEGLRGIKKENKWGFINFHGEEVISPNYDDIGAFSEGLVAAKINGKWGFIDKKGNPIIPFIYFTVSKFVDGKSMIQKETTLKERIISLFKKPKIRKGYIDKVGNEYWED